MIKVLNRVYNVILFISAFLAVLAIYVKCVSEMPFMNDAQDNTQVVTILFVVGCLVALVLAILLHRRLADLQERTPKAPTL